MNVNPAGINCRNRVIEWVCTGILLGYAADIFFWPNAISGGNFRYLIQIGVTPQLFFWSCFLVGCARAIALFFNGKGLPWSARLRALCAIFGAVVFGHLALTLAFIVKDGNPMPLGFWTHGLLVLAEMYSCLRAGADVNEASYKRPNPVLSARIVSTESGGTAVDLNVVDAVARPTGPHT
jgi:hypothetical protein